MSFLNDVEKQLDLPPGPKAEVMRELTSHYEEIREELLASSTPESQVDEETERRLGSPEDVAARLSAVHNVASWKSAVLFVLPLLTPLLVKLVMLALPYITPSAIALKLRNVDGYYILAAVTWAVLSIWLPGAVKALIRGRRPVWLASWLAAAVILADVAYLRLEHMPAVSPLSLAVAAYGLVLLWKKDWKWGVAAIVLAMLNLRGSDPSITGLAFINYGWLHTSALALFLAFRVFVLHPYAGAMQGTLVLWSYCALHAPFYSFTKGYEFLSDDWSVALSAALLGVAFIRTPHRWQKNTAVCSWLLLITVMPCIGSLLYHHSYDVMVTMFASVFFGFTLPIAIVVTLPLIYDTIQREKLEPPEVVQ